MCLFLDFGGGTLVRRTGKVKLQLARGWLEEKINLSVCTELIVSGSVQISEQVVREERRVIYCGWAQ